MYTEEWRKNFRFNTFRQGQEEALVKTARILDDGQKYVVAELPTGLGKSDIAMALALTSGNAFVTTSQNILINQYRDDFGHLKEFKYIKGKRHYECTFGFENCEVGDRKRCPNFKAQAECTYKIERDIAKASPVAFTNTTYFGLACGTWDDEGRDLAVIDEAHGLPNEVLNQVTFSLRDSKLKRLYLSNRIPDYKTKEVGPVEFERFVMLLSKELEDLLDTMDEPHAPRDMKEDIEDLYSRCCWYLSSLGAGVEWIVDYECDKYGPSVEAKPLDSAYFAQRMFFTKQATQYVLQSATIVNAKRYAQELGIEGGTAFKMPMAFAAANRPLYPLNACKMNHKELDGSLPKIAETIRTILKSHPDQKGIIHTGSYKIQKYIQDNLSFDRLIFPERGGVEAALTLHKESKEPTVLVSPAVTEGVDGKGDLVRFQVVCKIPYPYLGDRRIKILAERDWSWYNYQAAKTFIQALGRGVRSETDWCKNYVLDDGLEKFIKQASIGYYVNDCLQTTDEGWRSLK